MASLKIKLGEYELNTKEIIERIKKDKPKRILIQLPDGLKPYANKIVDFIESQCEDLKIKKPKIFIWASSSFGACDLPIYEAKQMKIDLLIHIGHEVYIK